MKCLFAEAVWHSSLLLGRSKIFSVEHRKTLMAFRFLRTHSRLHVSDKMWVGDGSARLFLVPPTNVQYACNNRNFANTIEMGLCPLLSHQPKPQSHTKRNKRKWGMGGMSKTRNVSWEKEEKERTRQLTTNSKFDKKKLLRRTRYYKYEHMKFINERLYVSTGLIEESKGRPSAAGRHDCASCTCQAVSALLRLRMCLHQTSLST